jgi:cell division protein FtsI (penicillin-binding protein 3)
VFSQVSAQTLRLLGVQPDLDVKSQIFANKGAVATEESF